MKRTVPHMKNALAGRSGITNELRSRWKAYSKYWKTKLFTLRAEDLQKATAAFKGNTDIGADGFFSTVPLDFTDELSCICFLREEIEMAGV